MITVSVVLDRTLKHVLRTNRRGFRLTFAQRPTLGEVTEVLGLPESMISVAVCAGRIMRADDVLEPNSSVEVFSMNDGG